MGKTSAGRTGADLKIGFGPNLTLDVTTNPDFGQVEADPAEVNLSAYETFFTEKRPFFIEGAGLLNSRFAETYFYSRRIGAAPVASASGDFVDYPHTSTILGAAKLTGRLPSKTSIGVLSAVTEAEHATTFDLASSARSRVPVGGDDQFHRRTCAAGVRPQCIDGRADDDRRPSRTSSWRSTRVLSATQCV